MLTPFHSFSNGQPAFFPVILNLQGFYLPVRDNQDPKGGTHAQDSPEKGAQLGLEAVKTEEGIGLQRSNISAFKTTHEINFEVFSPANGLSPTNSLQKVTKTPNTRRKGRASIPSTFDDALSMEESLSEKLNRVSWAKEEEQKLIQLVDLFGKHWKHISEHLPNRNPKQIRERYLNYLQANISTDKWTPEEDSRLLELVTAYGHRWKFIEKKMKKRSQNQLKNRYYGHLRKQQMKTNKPQSDLIPLPRESQGLPKDTQRQDTL